MGAYFGKTRLHVAGDAAFVPYLVNFSYFFTLPPVPVKQAKEVWYFGHAPVITTVHGNFTNRAFYLPNSISPPWKFSSVQILPRSEVCLWQSTQGGLLAVNLGHYQPNRQLGWYLGILLQASCCYY